MQNAVSKEQIVYVMRLNKRLALSTVRQQAAPGEAVLPNPELRPAAVEASRPKLQLPQQKKALWLHSRLTTQR